MRRPAVWNLSPLLVAAVLTAAASTLWADDGNAPERGVARVSLINGDVSVRRGDSGDWVAAAVNAPLVVGDSISSGPGSRAEVQFDSSNMLRLGSDAEVRLSDLQYGRYQIQVARGTVDFVVLRDAQAQVEISTPTVSVRPTKRGIYRISVGNVETEITTRSGEADIYTPKGVETLHSDHTMLVRGTADQPEYRVVAAIPRDEWDQWNQQRNRQLERAASYRYVNHDIYGAEDLDSNGRWIQTPEYGWVWSPYVSAGWAPYSYGRWSWVDWYGWSWVSYEPWGWAPFHYGRWFWRPSGWCWWPGAGYGRAYWSPALVAFFGFGGVGVGFGNVGWVPLAPFEPLYPWWGRRYYGYYGGSRGFNNVNIVNVSNVNITNVYRNARVVNGISAVNAGDFSQGRWNNVMRPGIGSVRDVRLAHGALPVAPGSGTLRFSDRGVAGTPRGIGNQRFFAHMQPAAVERVPFAEQQRSLERFGGAPGAVGTPAARQVEAVRPGAIQNSFRGAAGAPTASAPGSSAAAANGWRRFGQPAPAPAENSLRGGAAGAPTATAPGSPAAAANGWRRFGQPAPAPAENNLRGGPAAASPANPGGWRRFGEPGGAPAARTPEAAGPAGGWHRFGEPGSTPSARPEPGAGNGWRNFGEPRSMGPGGGASQRLDTAPRESQRGGQNFGNGRTEQNWGRGNGGFERPGRTQSGPRQLQIAPPVVRERPMQRSEAPAMRSAPRSYGGGGGERSFGGGGSRSSGGGGGGARSSGGGSRGGGRGR